MRDVRAQNVIKVRTKRSLYRESHPRLGPVVVKRFHAPGTCQGMRDAWRARREARALTLLAKKGLPVPSPTEVRKRNGAWELLTPDIPSAHSLADILEGRAAWPVPPPQVASTIGALLARLDRKGLQNGDLHPGNLLLDETGQPWLIDPTPEPLFSNRSKPTVERWIDLCAQVREISSPAFRARFLRAYQAASGPAPVPSVLAQRDLMEERAREARYTLARKRDARWLRNSGATWEVEKVRTASAGGEGTHRVTHFEDIGQAKRAWLRYGRAVEMRLPTLLPRTYQPQGSPADARCTIEAWIPTGASPLTCLPEPEQAGRLFGILHDRGLSVHFEKVSDLWSTPEGELLLDPEAIEWASSKPVPWMEPDPHFLWTEYHPQAETWRRFARAFCKQQNGSSRIQRELAAQMLHG